MTAKYVLDPNQTAFDTRSDGLLHLKGHRLIDARNRPYLNDPVPKDRAPATFLVPIEDVPHIVEGTVHFFDAVRPDWLLEIDISTMRPEPVSESGEAPATHGLCYWLNFTDRLWEEMRLWRAHQVPPIPATWIIKRWPVGTTKQQALEALGMKLVSQPAPAIV
jgi:hypothetical protein